MNEASYPPLSSIATLRLKLKGPVKSRALAMMVSPVTAAAYASAREAKVVSVMPLMSLRLGVTEKVAVTALSASMVTLQSPALAVHAPLQPLKIDPELSGVAVRVTVIPLSKSAEQLVADPLWQAILESGETLVTVPLPVPVVVTARVWRTVKSPDPASPPRVLTTNAPVEAPAGTVTVIWVAELTTKDAFWPARVTDWVVSKLLPVMVTVLPALPDWGEMPETEGMLGAPKTAPSPTAKGLTRKLVV